MTDEQKDILIAKIVDAPLSLSDSELDAILHDEELREIYEMSAAVAGAYAAQDEPEMESEWRSFRRRIDRRPGALKRAMSVAAVLLGVVTGAGIAVYVSDGVFSPDQSPAIASVSRPEKQALSPTLREEVAAEVTAPEAETEEEKADVSVQVPEAVDEEADIDIDIDEYLRIQQARVENDLAVMAAESYREEYGDIALILDAVGSYDLDLAIRNVTIE